MDWLRVQPLDVLFLRGNRLFGEGASAGSSMPPWPSVLSGALRTRVLIDQEVAFEAFRTGRELSFAVAEVLGPRADEPGEFALAELGMLRESHSIGSTEWIDRIAFPAPSDLIVEDASEQSTDAGDALLRASALEVSRPETRDAARTSSAEHLPCVPRHRTVRQSKAVSGTWISARGLGHHLRGEAIASEHLVRPGELWAMEPRVGVSLDHASRTAADGLLYRAEAVAMAPGASFLVGVEGAGALLPRDGLVRLGGDGRAASLEGVETAEASRIWRYVPGSPGFRLVLATPGIFPAGPPGQDGRCPGWLPPGVIRDGERWMLHLDDLEAELVAATVPRSEAVSGWDLAEGRPKPAERLVPRGAVYWFLRRSGDPKALQVILDEGLGKLAERRAQDDATRKLAAQRRAEGFGRIWLGSWDPGTPGSTKGN